MEQNEFGNDILTLVDEEGVEHSLEVLDAMDFEDGHYLAMVPVFEESEELLDDMGELVILKAAGEEEDSYLEPIEDEDEFNKVAEIFMDRLKDTFEFKTNTCEKNPCCIRYCRHFIIQHLLFGRAILL